MPLPDTWTNLRCLTPARIALGRAGSSQPTDAVLDFQLAHARARDAVQHRPDLTVVTGALEAGGVSCVNVSSRVSDSATYLTRPDLGRRLREEDAGRLATLAKGESDLALVIADGLSGMAVERHAGVAVGDEIGERLRSRLVAVLIGERPGLSSPDSLGVYLTWAPRIGRTDAERNCISNIRPEGLPLGPAADKLLWLMTEARRRQLTGVNLKEEIDGRLLR
jgi:ethanolamine ammonia-lyase small subunit